MCEPPCMFRDRCGFVFLPVKGLGERGGLDFRLLPKVVAFVSYDILYNF